MKKFEVADIEVLDLVNTAFGPLDRTHQDSELYADFDEDGNITGYHIDYGEDPSNN